MHKEDHLQTNRKKINTKLKIVSFLLFLVCVFIAVYLMEKNNIVIYCPILKITGFYCPGCGITRMFISLLSGNIYQAFRYNPLVFILFIFIPIYFIVEKYINKNTKKKILYGLLVIVLVYTIARNIPIFSFLEPTQI